LQDKFRYEEINMLEQIMKSSIENKTKEITHSNAFLKKAAQGTLTRDEAALYLYNLIHLFSQTPQDLQIGADKAKSMGLIELSEFLASKIKEEIGHENWPKQDLNHYFSDAANERYVTPATQSVLDYIRSLVKSDPRLYLSYMAFVEYFTVLAAPEFVDNLDKKCGISRLGMTAITNHQISDQDHIQEDLRVISGFVNEVEIQDQMLAVVNESGRLVEGLFNSCIKNTHH
jgi:hypothetical protein